MKINFVVPEITRTGGIRTVFELANRLTLRGYDVILYAPGIPFNPYKGMIVPYYIRYRMNYVKDYLLGRKSSSENIFERKFAVKFVPLIRNTFIRNADISVATSWTTSFAVNRLSRSKGKKFYFIQDYEIWFSNTELADKSYTLPFKRIVVSAYLKNLLYDRFGSDSTEILIGINYDIFKNPDKKFLGKKSILFMDHMLENKNTEGAIKTAVELKEKYPELTLRCFGIDKYHNMPEYVEFFKNPDDRTIVGLYCNSDIFIFPGKYEGFGATPAEAMACKCAVVANAVAAIPEYAVNGDTAILTDPDKPEDLYRGVSYLLENEPELQRISLAGYEHVRKILDWEKALDKFEEVLNKAI